MFDFLASMTAYLANYKIKAVVTPEITYADGIPFNNEELCRYKSPEVASDFVEYMLNM